MWTVEQVDFLATIAHAGQTDKIGIPHIRHVRAVAAGLRPFGPDLQMAGLLHDAIEDTHLTGEQLRAAGIPSRVVSIVEAVTNTPDVSYQEKIRRIASSRDATLVKIADNAHNSRPDRAAQLPEEKRARLAAKYRSARDVLWAAVDSRDVEMILATVNPALLGELAERKMTRPTMPDETCGLPHYDYPETRCAEPVGRHARDERGVIHAAPLIIDGRECGAVAWRVPRTDDSPDPHACARRIAALQASR